MKKQCFDPSRSFPTGFLVLFSRHRALHQLQFGGRGTVSTAQEIAESFSNGPRDGTENVSLHNSPGYPNKHGLVRFKLSDFVSLCLIWTRINLPSLSRPGTRFSPFSLSLFVRMACSEHHRPRGMCSCLAIINISYR